MITFFKNTLWIEWSIRVSHPTVGYYNWQCKTMVNYCNVNYMYKTVVINRAFMAN